MRKPDPEILDVMEQCVTCQSFIDLNEALTTDTGDVVCVECLQVITCTTGSAAAASKALS